MGLDPSLQDNEVEHCRSYDSERESSGRQDILVENGVRAIWNFAHIDLNLPDRCHCGKRSLIRKSYAVSIQYQQI